MNLEELKTEFLIGDVYINGIKAGYFDKVEFLKDRKSGKVKSRIYRYNGIFDVITEGWYVYQGKKSKI